MASARPRLELVSGVGKKASDFLAKENPQGTILPRRGIPGTREWKFVEEHISKRDSGGKAKKGCVGINNSKGGKGAKKQKKVYCAKNKMISAHFERGRTGRTGWGRNHRVEPNSYAKIRGHRELGA